jgi:hypothetical protein
MIRVGLLLLLLQCSLAGAGEMPAEIAPGTSGTGTSEAGATADPAALPPPPVYAERLRREARQVLQTEDFHQRSEMRSLVRRNWLKRWMQPKPQSAHTTTPHDFSTLAETLKFLMLAVLGLALGWLLWRGWQWLAPGPAKARPLRPPAPGAHSVDLNDIPLPDGISQAARAAWQAGDAALALSLLYRGAVRALAERYRLELPDSATEGECLRLARRSGKAVVDEGFAPIVQAWVALAYARRPPADFEQLARLYIRCFEAASGAGHP